MKKLFYSLASGLCVLSLGILLYSCGKDEMPVSKSEQSLNLTTANGEKLAPSMSALKKSMAPGIAAEFGTDVDFTITSIEHLALPYNGYVAIINYETSNGIKSNVIWTNAVLNKDGKFVSTFKTRTETEGGGTAKKYKCTGSCKSGSCYSIADISDPKEPKISCSCDEETCKKEEITD